MSEGRLDFTIGLDIEGLKRNAEQSKKTIEDIGKSASETGGIIDKSFNDKNFGGLNDMRESIKLSQEYLEQLKAKYQEVSNAIKSAPLGSDTSQLQADMAAINSEIQAEETALAGLQAKYDQLSSTSVPSVRSQIRELNNTLMQMRIEGQENTEQYRQLEQELGRLATVQRQVQNARKADSSGATALTAWLQGVQGLAGAYAAASGAASLFVKDQEKLMAVQSKMQSLMAILIGLQQASNALHSASMFRLRALSSVQTAYNAVIGATSAGLQGLGLSARAADIAAKALYATLTLGITVAVTALIELWNKYQSEQEKAAEAAKEMLEIEKSGREAMVQGQAELDRYTNKIRNFTGTREDERKLVDELNQKYGESFGYYSTLADWYDTLINKGEIYIQTLFNQAKAQSLVTKAVEADEKAAQKRSESENYTMGLPRRVGTFIGSGFRSSAVSETEQRLQNNYLGEAVSLEAKRDQYLKEAQELYTEIDELQKQLLEGGGTTNPSTTRTTTSRVTDNTEKEIQARIKALQDLAKLQNSLIENNQKESIELYEDGFNKRMAQLDFQREQEMKKLQETAAEMARLNQEAGLETGDDGLTLQQREDLYRAQMLIDEKYRNDQQDLLNQELKDLETYEQQRERIIREYAARREALYEHDTEGNRTGLRQGVTQGNVENLDQQEQETLQAMEDTLLTRQEWYKQWCDAITSLSLEQLQALMQIAKASLEEMKANGADAETIAQQEAMIRTINDEIGKMTTSPNKNSVSDWQKLYKTLNTCEKEFERVGDAIGGTAGDIIKVSGQIASSTLSMFNSLNELSNQFKKSMDDVEKIGKDAANIIEKTGEGAAKATEDAAKGASGAISTVEKASVILTVISAALSIATAIANLFNNDDKKQKEIDNLQQQIDQLQWELDNTEAVRIQNKLGDALTVVRNIYAETVKEIERMHEASKDYGDTATKSLTKVQKETEAYNKSIQKIADTYANLSYTTTEVLGTEKYSSAREQLENYAEQLKLIQEQYELEDAKKKTDTEQLAEYQQQMDEIAATMSTLVNQLVEEIVGGSASDIASQLGDAFIEAFQAGEDAALAWGDTVDDIVSNIIKSLLISEIIEPQIGAVFDKYKDLWYDSGEFAGTKAIIDSMQDFANDLNAIEGEFAEVWDTLSESMLDYFTTDTERTGVNQGIATASQESVDELNGRATVIQSHTFSINETTKSMLVTANLILQSIVNIEGNTDGLSTRMATVESYVKEMRDTTNDMARLGVKIR